MLIFSLVIFLWLFTSVPLFISGILGVLLSIITGLMTTKEAFAPFADPIIFLFLGGFLLAKALEKTELDQRIANRILANSWVRSHPSRRALAFLLMAFVASMWISNTAALAMLLPLALGLFKNLEREFDYQDSLFEEQFLLALAYSATLGGNITPIGSPPNALALGFLQNLTGGSLTFLEWMIWATPPSLIVFYFVAKNPRKMLDHLKNQRVVESSLTLPFKREQKFVLFAFGLTIFLWVIPSFAMLTFPEFTKVLKASLSSAMVAMLGASLLFLFPLKSPILTSKDLKTIDWSSLLLFGSGLSLGKMLFKTGAAQDFAKLLLSTTESLGVLGVLIILVCSTIILTELASNTASASILIPLAIAFMQEVNMNATPLAFLMAIACNSAFMLPVATPPNVIVYGTEKIKKLSMIKAGFKINLLWMVLLTLALLLLN